MFVRRDIIYFDQKVIIDLNWNKIFNKAKYRAVISIGMPLQNSTQAITNQQNINDSGNRLPYVLGIIGLFFGSFFFLWNFTLKSSWLVDINNYLLPLSSALGMLIISSGLVLSIYAFIYIWTESQLYFGKLKYQDMLYTTRADFSYLLLFVSVSMQFIFVVFVFILFLIPNSQYQYIYLPILVVMFLLAFIVLFIISARTIVKLKVLIWHFIANFAMFIILMYFISFLYSAFFQVLNSDISLYFESGRNPKILYTFEQSNPNFMNVNLDKVLNSNTLNRKLSFSKSYPITEYPANTIDEAINYGHILFTNRNKLQLYKSGVITLPNDLPKGTYQMDLSFRIGSYNFNMTEGVKISRDEFVFLEKDVNYKL